MTKKPRGPLDLSLAERGSPSPEGAGSQRCPGPGTRRPSPARPRTAAPRHRSGDALSRAVFCGGERIRRQGSAPGIPVGAQRRRPGSVLLASLIRLGPIPRDPTLGESRDKPRDKFHLLLSLYQQGKEKKTKRQTGHRLYVPCEISLSLPYNHSCEIKNKLK